VGDTKIPYLTKTWNPIEGCTPVSAGCDHCWAQAYLRRWKKPTTPTLHPERLEQPLHWKKPQVIGVSFLGDLFHDDVTLAFATEVMVMMGRACKLRGHRFLVLTKRPEAMAEYVQAVGVTPPAGIWWGVSVEDQATADERIPLLLETPAAHRWVSLEPQVGPVDLGRFTCGACGHTFNENQNTKAAKVCCPSCHHCDEHTAPNIPHWLGCSQSARSDGYPKLDWVVQGCESGPGRRPFDVAWARVVRDQCAAAGVPYYLKQMPYHGKVLAPGHGFNSERSQRAENGGRP
jgi:protein gp37